MLNRVTTISSPAGLEINREKTEFMVISKRNIQNINLYPGMDPLERVPRFKHLGYTINRIESKSNVHKNEKDPKQR
ncbi:hypothetical protein JTB14_030589 [Gonioctena quinquepunctata]|nr:hypothetical protein JTB14_030589 [Gonioctena quinquepunctata]